MRSGIFFVKLILIEVNVMRTLRSGGMNYDSEAVSLDTAMFHNSFLDPSRTIQSGKDDADINVIVKRFMKTGQAPVNARMPEYGDYNGVGDFQTAMNVIRQAEESFMSLPSGIRKKFGNDPQAFLEFCSDKENLPELRKMGLAIPEKIDDNVLEPVIPPVKGDDGNARPSSKRAGKSGKASEGSEGSSDA